MFRAFSQLYRRSMALTPKILNQEIRDLFKKSPNLRDPTVESEYVQSNYGQEVRNSVIMNLSPTKYAKPSKQDI